MLDKIELFFFGISATTCRPRVETVHQQTDHDPNNRSGCATQCSSKEPAELLLPQIRTDADKDGKQEQLDWIAQVHLVLNAKLTGERLSRLGR